MHHVHMADRGLPHPLSSSSYRCRCLTPFTSQRHPASRRNQVTCAADQGPGCGGGGAQRQAPALGNLLQKVGVAAAAAAASAGVLLGALPPMLVQPAEAITNEQLVYLEAWRAVDRAYVDKTFNGNSWFRVRERALKQEPMGDREETYAAIRRTLALLDDPFTRLLEPARYAALKRGNAGSVTGVGLEVGYAPEGKGLVVVTPSPGGPADRAGVQPQDRLLAVDGVPADSLYEVGSQLQGAQDTQVTITLEAAKGGRRRDVTLTRQPITFNPVTSELCAGGGGGSSDTSGPLGYIRVATFSRQTADSVRSAIKSLQKQGAQRWVLDVRNNGGGSFPAGVQVAKMWLDDGDIVLIADSDGVRDVYEADGTALEASAPLSVLVNRGTASASEVLAGALKVLAGALRDHKRATIAGEPTFGKGLIQTLVELSDGSAVAVTVSRYQTPAGVDINKKGIQPDLAVEEGALPPPGAGGFCKAIQQEGAPALFN